MPTSLLLDHTYLLGPPKFSPVAEELCRAHPKHLKDQGFVYRMVCTNPIYNVKVALIF